MDRRRIASTDEVSTTDTLLCTLRDRDTGEQREAIVLETEDGVRGWRNHCQHFTHVRLDKGSGAPLRDGEIVCENHGAMFEATSGKCTFGPCEGAFLTEIDLTVENGDVYLADESYEFVGMGPVEDDDADLTSTSNVEFCARIEPISEPRAEPLLGAISQRPGRPRPASVRRGT